ncbi:MAG: proline--tRNA ligase [Bacilli bacterium]|nr:proline--tRNA ligase [Mollicutes bacterium]MDY3899545.1 proline--tRNA ligase [Bacilli bacterium]
MKASKMIIATLKEAPNEAQISSHILLIRAGMIRKLVAGVYNYLPIGLRTLYKVEKIIREEMDEAGGQEILSSAIQPKELWVESGRWQKYGPELIRFKDRHEREFCLGPTHEEIFTDLVRNEIKSRKSLPLNIYQIQTKYRDELRPRFGLMRSREFIMKDAYSFDLDESGLDVSYHNMYETYKRIFDRFGLNYKIVLADTGAIGGSGSHQFMAISEIGESDIAYCDCGYAADEEKATSLINEYKTTEDELPLEKVHTPNQKTIEEVSSFLKLTPKDIVKSIVYKDLAHNELVMVLVRGDRDVNEIKVVNALDIAEYELVLASYDDILSIGSVEGFVSPIGLNVKTLVDDEVAIMKNFVVGGNESNYHFINANFKRDFTGQVIEVRKVALGDRCPICGKPLKMEKGIEVGQIFKLGTKYSKPMNCVYQDENGELKPIVMGCYGIGVTRTMSSIIEQYHDEHGICWPLNVAPYHVVIVPINYNDETMRTKATELYEKFKTAGVEVVLDDRDERPGFKFKDWELIGIPYIITVGRLAGDNIVEFKERKTMIKKEKSLDEAYETVVDAVRNCR